MVLEFGNFQVVGLRSTKGAPSVQQCVLVFGIKAKSDCFKCSNNECLWWVDISKYLRRQTMSIPGFQWRTCRCQLWKICKYNQYHNNSSIEFHSNNQL